MNLEKATDELTAGPGKERSSNMKLNVLNACGYMRKVRDCVALPHLSPKYQWYNVCMFKLCTRASY